MQNDENKRGCPGPFPLRGFSAIVLSALLLVAAALLPLPSLAYGLDVEEYVPGQDYYIDSPDAFTNQDIDHKGAEENSGATAYWLTCPFYLEWTSENMTINEGEDAAIACRAVGLDDLHYEWDVSTDGGDTFSSAELIGSSHTLMNMKANNPANQPYLYKCTVTNGDGVSQLDTMVSITVLPKSITGKAAQSVAKTGDSLLYVITGLYLLLFFVSYFILFYPLKRKDQTSKAAETGNAAPLPHRR